MIDTLVRPRFSSPRLFIIWVLANMLFFIAGGLVFSFVFGGGWSLVIVLTTSIKGAALRGLIILYFFIVVILGTIIGGGIGFGQWAILRQRLVNLRLRSWLSATGVAIFSSALVFIVIVASSETLEYSKIIFLLAWIGISLGLFQSLALHRVAYGSSGWFFANMIGWLLVPVIIWIIGRSGILETAPHFPLISLVLFYVIVVVTPFILSGAVLAWRLKPKGDPEATQGINLTK
jgi:hypothetical protein